VAPPANGAHGRKANVNFFESDTPSLMTLAADDGVRGVNPALERLFDAVCTARHNPAS
jgi:hypothetical protein